jgi:HEAT repeat protein
MAVQFPKTLNGVTPSAHVQEHHDGKKSKSPTDAIKDLGSDDQSLRAVAYETLLRSGPARIAPLVELLKQLTPKIEVCPATSNLPCRIGSRLRSDNKRTRMQSDAIGLLGQLHAVEAVPLLIRILGQFESEGAGFRYWGPEMIALIEIGSSAVPELLDSLRLAEEMRQNVPLDNGSLAPYLEIQVRIIEVLGHIDDERPLMLFEELRKSNPNHAFLSYLSEAEERIRQKR